MANDYEKVREVFLGASERPAGAERESYLAEACGQDQELRARVAQMLSLQTKAAEFFQAPSGEEASSDGGTPHSAANEVALLEAPGTVIGRYKLLEKIGEGGFGVVYMAEQLEPLKRKVALKIIKLGMDTREVIARFDAERQALALMDHPNVARVLDAGSTESGRPFFVMELVRGQPITEFCDRECLEPQERIELFISVCRAAQHAHSKGIIHRDLKPSNVLVTMQDGRPIPKVIDFGIAKAIQKPLTERTLFTKFGQMIGTPVYMSPEQTEFSAVDVDTRSDVYSLGVIFYELLTSKQPFDLQRLLQVGHFEMLRIIREEEPLRPSTRLTRLGNELATVAERRHLNSRRLGEMVRGDLDWITMKALQKDRSRRYETAAALAEDLVRYLEHRPVRAGPPSWTYRSLKFVQRHRYAVATFVWILLALMFGLVFAVYGLFSARAEREVAVSAERTAERQRQYALLEAKRSQAKELAARQISYASDMALASHALDAGNLGRALGILSRYKDGTVADDLRGWEWRYLWQQCQSAEIFQLTALSNSVLLTAVSADGRLAAVSDLDGRISVWNLPGRSLLWSSNCSTFFALSPDGKLLADGKRLLRDAESGIVIRKLPGEGELQRLKFSADGSLLAGLVETKGLCMWEGKSWSLRWTSEGLPAQGLHFGDLAFSAGGKWLAVGTVDGSIKVVDTESGRQLREWAAHGEGVTAVAVSPDSSLIASVSGYAENAVRLWKAEDGSTAGTLQGHRAWIPALTFSANGALLASAGADQSVCVWHVAQKQLLARLKGHLHEVWDVAFLPDGQTLLSGGKDGTVKVWTLPQEAKATAERQFQPAGIAPEETLSGKLVFSGEGRELLALEKTGWIGRWALPSLRQLGRIEELGSNNLYLASSPRLGLVTALDRDGNLRVWSEQKQALRTNISVCAQGRKVSALDFAAEVGRLVVVSEGAQTEQWDTGSWNRLSTWRLPEGEFLLSPAVSPEGIYLASCGNQLTVYWASNGMVALRSTPHKPYTDAVAFSPDGKYLATGSQEGLAKVWTTGTWKEVATLRGHLLGVHSLAFSPDGRRIATGSLGGEAVKLWDLTTMQEVLNLAGPGDLTWRLGFSPDGRILMGLGTMTGVRCWSGPWLDDFKPGEMLD